MIPVLSLKDPVAGAAFLCRHLGFMAGPEDPLLLVHGDQMLRLAAVGAEPGDLFDFPFDHLAIRVADADRAAADGLARGAEYHPGFTPDGPCDIPAFGASGVRYVFFRGPEGWPVEFVAPLGVAAKVERTGHDHFGLRVPDVAGAGAELRAMGATVTASHRLGEGAGMVHVDFLRLGDSLFEVFDVPPLADRGDAGGWIGFVG